jgi:hypothetical protein
MTSARRAATAAALAATLGLAAASWVVAAWRAYVEEGQAHVLTLEPAREELNFERKSRVGPS